MIYPLIARSLKAKIFFLYILGILFGLIFIIVSYETLRSSNQLLMRNEVIAELIETILEMRRFEKNYLLYHHLEDLEAQERYLYKSKEILEQFSSDFKALIGSYNYEAFHQALMAYTKVFHQIKNEKPMDLKDELFSELRERGKNLTLYIEWMNKIKEQQIRRNLEELKRWLFLAFALFLVLVFFYTLYLYTSLTRPLKRLENYIFEIIQGKFCAVPPVFSDKEIQLLVEAINKMLAELDRRKDYLIQTERLATFGTLLFSIAHELNNPLNNIYTSCQILKEEIEVADTAFKRELLEEMEREIERTQGIIKSILDYSKPSEKERVFLKSLLEETLHLIKGKLPSKVDILIKIPEDFTICADPQQMKQVFINLFKNAFDALENREGVITVSAEEKEEECLIYFSDNGPGIPLKILSHIFDPFFTTKEGKKRYGLGLFIVYNLIKNHGGTIEVESEVDKGTTFIIKIPKGRKKENGKG